MRPWHLRGALRAAWNGCIARWSDAGLDGWLARARKQKAPVFSRRRGLFCSLAGASESPYMWSIMTWPEPEQLTCLAPSISRAKSYVTFLLAIDFFIELMMRSAASIQPMWRSIISAERISEPGFT